MDEGRYHEALEALQAGLKLSHQANILSATRAIMRLKAKMFRKQHKPAEALQCLEKVLAVSIAMEEFSGDADVFGEIADLYADLGNMEQAAEYYDRCLNAISSEQPSQLSSTWDMP